MKSTIRIRVTESISINGQEMSKSSEAEFDGEAVGKEHMIETMHRITTSGKWGRLPAVTASAAVSERLA